MRKAVKDRETSKSTGIGYGIALPHASVACIQDVVAVFGRVAPGVDFQALDNQPVTLCLLFLTPQGQFQKHLLLLSTVARFLSNKDNRQKLEAAAVRRRNPRHLPFRSLSSRAPATTTQSPRFGSFANRAV